MPQAPAPSSDSAATKRSLKFALLVGALFMVLIAIIIYLLGRGIVTPQMALLMFVALLGLYVGFGVLIAVYRFINKLE